ncbi:MAG: methionine biosynthesis protein MetW, partial [Alphaproteobacteria bacterium]
LVRGLSVIQGNAEQDLAIYSDNSFDYAVLSQTIQATHNPPKILLEMLRIANFAIVSLPNFAHLQNRMEILFRGRMPVNKSIPYQWYETPNIHFCSIIDFEKLCDDLDLIIVKKIFLTNNHRLIGFFGKELLANLLARYGLFLITKKEFLLSGQEEFAFKNNIRIPYSKAIPSLMQKKVD